LNAELQLGEMAGPAVQNKLREYPQPCREFPHEKACSY